MTTRRLLVTVAVAMAIAAGFLVRSLAASRGTPAKLTAAEIVAGNVAARGGLDAWHKVDTMVWTGHISTSHGPSPILPFTLEQKRPNKTRMEIDALGSRSLRIFDGARGWKVRSGRGQPDVQPFTPQEVAYAHAGHGIEGPLIARAAQASTVTLEGVDEVGDRKAYHLKLRSAKATDEEVWVDTETLLELRYDRMVIAAAGSARRISMTYGDYRTVDGLQIPFLIQTGVGSGQTPDKMQLDRVTVNAPLEDSAFANPAGSRFHQRGLAGLAARTPTPMAANGVPRTAAR
jgi:hypothetical protein